MKVYLGAFTIITFTMFLIGILLGFIGAGGSGFIIAILTVVFGVPIHTALGTSLAAMVFTTLSGAYSHYRQGNIDVKAGLTAGIFGAIFSYFGSRIAVGIPVDSLHWLTAGMLFLPAVMLMTRLFLVQQGASLLPPIEKLHDVSIYVGVEVAKAAIEEGIARADITDVAKAVADAVWEPEYKEFKSVGNWASFKT